MPLAAGNIAFVGFNADGNDNLAFVALVDINAGDVIFFEDNEWNGTAFVDTNEGAFSWTATTLVSAGTIVRIDNIGSGTITASTGTAVDAAALSPSRGTNRGIGNSNEVIYAYQGTAAAPTFITAIANSGFSATTGTLTNTGLTVGVNTIDLSTGVDIAAYTGTRSGEASFAAYLPLINNPANWVTQDGSGDQSMDTVAPDVPFSSTAFALGAALPTPAGVTISQSGGTTDVIEGGLKDTYTIALNTQPTNDVTITIGNTAQTTTNPTTLTFTTANWNVAQTVTVTAVNDATQEGAHTGNITHTAASSDANYNGIAIASVTANITEAGFLTKIGGFTSMNGAEIPAFDPGSDRLFVVAGSVVEILNFADPTSPTKITDLAFNTTGDPDGATLGGFALLPNSVAVGQAGTISEGLVAVSIAITNQTTLDDNLGEVQFFNAANGTYLGKVNVGYLPDMVTFTPDGTKVLTANEGQPNNAYTNDPVGSVSIIDLTTITIAGGISSATVSTASFDSFNSQIDSLRASGVRIFGPGSSVAQDLEPEYITFSGDGTKAWVTLQENNAIAVVNIATATVESILPLGVKDHNSVTVTNLETFEFKNLPSIGTTTGGQELLLGGFSGLFYEGTAANGNLKFLTHTDRGPNGEPTGSNRPFLLPNFSPEIVRFELNRSTGAITITERINIKRADGTPITGLPNTSITGGTGNTPYNDEVPVDLNGNTISPLDTFGADLEGIVVNPTDGTFWMVDEYRPAIYQFGTDGKLIERFVPTGTGAAAGQTAGTFGTEALPAVIAQRRQNRGFEAVALNTDNNKLYAFVQSPIRNPAALSNGNLNGLNNIRIVEFDLTTKTVTAQYLYRMDNLNLGTPENSRPDKIGDAVYIGNGEFLVVERDDDALPSGDPLSNIEKKVYRFSLAGATNVNGQDGTFDVGGGVLKSIDQMTTAELAGQSIRLINKVLHVDLAKAGYANVEKVEGLALIDANTIAVINDNDFQVAGITLNGDGTFTPDPSPEPVVLGLITTNSNGLDASDRDVNFPNSGSTGKINIRNWPVFGLYQPDSIASFTANGQTYYVTANEGDTRDYTGYSEESRLSAVGLDTTVFPNATTLDDNQNLGRLNVTTASGNTDSDPQLEQIFVPGARSFSIWDSTGKLVYDSGDDFEQITAAAFPTRFNASNTNTNLDDRSDNKGPEPEGVAVGTINGRTYAFIGLERIGGVMVYEVTNPTKPAFVQYLNTRDFSAAVAGDSGAEGLIFIPASDSPNGQPLLVVAYEISNTVAVFSVNPGTRISDIQGAGHTSPLVGQTVTAVPGIVTAVDSNGFYLQDPTPDGNDATSEAIFVFTSSAPTVKVGDQVTVTGTVSEFTPGGSGTGNLSTTQIGGSPTVTVLSSNNPLPNAIILGAGGRVPPNQVIDNDPLNSFDPATDGIDFYESLEGMRVTIKDAVAVSPTNRFGEIYTVADNGAGATGLSQRGTINISPTDFNPERIQIDEDEGVFNFSFPNVNVGDKLGDVTGVVGYNFGNFEVIPTSDFTGNIKSAGLQPEVTTLTKGSNKLTVASYNVLNLDPQLETGVANNNIDDDVANGRFTKIAQQIVTNLGAPDIIGLQEVQDNSGAQNDGVTTANVTLQTLVDAIAAAGGPTYQFIDNTFIVDNASGGQPGGNIRTAYLYNPGRVGLVDGSVQAITGTAFADARLPLVASFTFNGETVTLVNNHFSSKGGSSPLFGVNQPSVGDEANGNGQENVAINGSLNERQAQAQAVNNFVDSLLATNANANVVVLGDLNEFEFISPLSTLAGGSTPVLTNLVNTLPENERYSFIFDGNSQQLDHILVSNNLSAGADFDIVNINTEFVDNPQRASDHDPLVARLTLGETFTLQILHTADQEAGVPALDDAPRFSAVLNALKNQDLNNDGLPDYADTLLLSSGDAFIPGLFLSASQDVFGLVGAGDILIQNELGFQAIAFGNHEFDLGTEVVRNLISNSKFVLSAPLSEAQEVAATPVVDTAATGQVSVFLSGSTLRVNGSFSSLSSALRDTSVDGVDSQGNNIDSIHIHRAVAGSNGPIIRALRVSPDNTGRSGTFTGIFTLTAEEVTAAENGELYVNIHTENNPGGELRGQLNLNRSFPGTNFPYLSSNLDFSTDANLAGLVVADDQAPRPNSIAATTVIDVNGEKIGVVGATTPTLRSISSPGGVTVSPQPFAGNPTPEQLDALAAEIQKDVDELLVANPGLNKVVLLAHMQQIGIEQALATRLKNVDIIIAGGSNTRLLDETDRLRAGDTAQGTYPIITTDANGTPVAIVNTDGNYKYVGRLVIDFDQNGVIIPASYNPNVSGAYATDAQGVADLNAENLVDPEIQAIVDQLRTVILAKESNVFGVSDVYLEGLRPAVRQQETNLGNLTADANLALAKQVDPTVVISLKNGGGIRDDIGRILVPTGGTGTAERLPNEAVTDAGGNIVKPTGGISETDIANALAFNNGLSLVTVTATELLALIEHGVAASTLINQQGRFPQVSGLAFSFDLTRPAGDRILSLAIEDEQGRDLDVVVRDGEIVGDPNRTFRMVTLNFLAGGGDGYPFPTGASTNRVDLAQSSGAPRTGAATFAPDGSEQDALAEYLAANFNSPTNAFNQADTPVELDTRIQNLAFRADTVLDASSIFDLGNSKQEDGVIAILRNLTLNVAVTTISTSFVNELVVFKVEDAQGSVRDSNNNLITPGASGFSQVNYLNAIVNAATTQVVFSTLNTSDDLPNAFQPGNSQSDVDISSRSQLGFFLVVNGTLGDVENNPASKTVFFSTLDSAQLTDLTTTNFKLAFGDDGVGGFDDLVFTITAKEQDLLIDSDDEFSKIGRAIDVGGKSVEAIDLKNLNFDFNKDGTPDDITGKNVAIQATLYREARFDNLIGFYVVAADGSVNGIAPTAANRQAYARAAFDNRLGAVRAPGNETTGQATFTFTGGDVLLPFIISNASTPNADFSNIYFPFLGVNADGADHIRLLGNGIFGFEDLVGGGDQDFDDVIVQITKANLAA
ncbi:MAG: choice-of-anchor I family protein [Leptolyngbyaceae bacterium]|nr:choice-of-anchor I family protein [Leptolyngbyaceae bacterium]